MVFHPRDPSHRNVSRRDFLRRSLAAGVALPTSAAILAACGDDGGTNPPPEGEDIVPRFGTLDNPVTLQTYEDNPPIDSNLEPEAGPLVDLQLGAVHLEARAQGLRQEVQRRGQVRDLLQHGAGDPEVPDGRGRRGRVLPDDRLHPQARREQADPAAEPGLHPEHQEPLAGDAGPVLRPGVAVHRAVHDLPHRHGVADRHRAGGGRGRRSDVEPVRDLLERRLRRQGRDLRRLSGGPVARDVPGPRGPDEPRRDRPRGDQHGQGSVDRAQRPRRGQDDDRRRLLGRPRRQVRAPPGVVRRHPGGALLHERSRRRSRRSSAITGPPATGSAGRSTTTRTRSRRTRRTRCSPTCSWTS